MNYDISLSNLNEARLVLAIGLLGLFFYVFNNWKPWLFYLAILWGMFRILDNWENWLEREKEVRVWHLTSKEQV